MKRFLVFAGSTYYPSGGWRDYRSAHDTIEDAKTWLLKTGDDFDWWQIVDTETMTTVDHHDNYGRLEG